MYGQGMCNKCKGIKRKGYKHRKESIKKMSISAKKRIRKNFSLEACKNMVRIGKINGRYIDNRSNQKYYCINCDKEILWRTWNYGTKRCPKCSSIENGKKYRGRFTGKKSWSYIHGKGYEPYTSKFTQKLKDQIRKRDNYKCQNCNITEKEHLERYDKVLDIHHIDYNKQNCNEENLISLCRPCNIKANTNRKYWQECFRKEIKGG